MVSALTGSMLVPQRRPPAAPAGLWSASISLPAFVAISQTVSRICSATSLVVWSSQITRVLSRIASAALSARPASAAIRRAVSQIVTRSAAATTMMTVATPIHTRHAAQRSALVIGVLASGARVVVILPVARPVDAPEAIFLAGRSAGFLRGEVLPLAVEELDGFVGERLGLNVCPAARHFTGDVPAVL